MISTEKGQFEVGIVNSTMTNLMQQNEEEKKEEGVDKHKNQKLYNALHLQNERTEPKLFICVEKNEAF